MDIQHGLPTLGQINLFERKILGDDALYEIAQQKMQDGSMQNIEEDSFRKSLDRFCAEETKDHKKIQDYEPYAIVYGNYNISMLSEYFYKSLENKYGVPYKLCLEIGGFSADLYGLYQNFNPYTMRNKINQFQQNDKDEYEGGKIPLVAENKTVEFVFFIFKFHILFALYDSIDKNFEKTKEFIKIYLTDFLYSALYERLRIERNCKSFSALYDSLDNKSVSNPFKLFIERSKKNEKSPKWTELEKLLPFCSDELKKLFIAKFLLSNTENALQEVFCIPKEKIDEIKNGLIFLLKENSFSRGVAKKLCHNILCVSLQDDKDERDPFCGKTNGIASKRIQIMYSLIFYRHKQKKPGPLEKRETIVEALSKFVPHSSAFFIPYFKAYIAVTNREFDKAMVLFNTAFEYKQFAGDYLIEFLEMAFSFANYYEADWTTTRKSIKEENGIKNPVKCDAKMFKNFGYAINAFPDSAKNSYFEAYRPLEHFYAFFPVECFVDVELAKKIQKQEVENQQEIKIETDGRRNSKFVKNHPYEVLSKLNGKDRNKLIPEKSLFTLNQDHNLKQKDLCPPIVLCIRYSFYNLSDERLLSIAENWLKYPNPEIETTAVSYDGKTALCETLRIYGDLRLHFYSNNSDIRNLPADTFNRICRNGYLEDSEEYELEIKKIVQKTHSLIRQQKIKLARYKRLIKQLIERTNWEKELKFGERIPVLAWAIECYDFEIVKLIADKIPDAEFDNYRISANYMTPLVHTILRKEPVSFGLLEFIRKHKDIHIPHKVNRALGFTREEKCYISLYENPRPKGIDFTMYHMEHWEEQLNEEEVDDFIIRYGDEETYEEQVSEYDKMIDYFISRTKDINAFVTTISMLIECSDEGKNVSVMQGDQVHSTTLVIAAQANDSDTCKKLLKRGAKVDFSVLAEGLTLERFRETLYQQKNNFIYTLIDYKSWETLIMFLIEFPDIVKTIMHNDEFELNPLVSFAMKVQDYFIWTSRDKREWRPIVQYITNLFIACGANPDEKSSIGNARELLESNGISVN